MKNYSVLHILELYHIYRDMDKQEKKNFYQHKCDYYQFFVRIIIIIASLASLSYLVSCSYAYINSPDVYIDPSGILYLSGGGSKRL